MNRVKIWLQHPPKVLLAALILTVLAAGNFYLAVQAGHEQSVFAVDTLGTKAPKGIDAAQKLTTGLTEMHDIAAGILSGSGQSTQTDYNETRRQVSAALEDAAQNVHYGTAETVPIDNVQYVLPKYHAAVMRAFDAKAKGDMTSALSNYSEADRLMKGTILPNAQQLDIANTKVLNDTYQDQIGASSHIVMRVVGSGILLLLVLALTQLYITRNFKRGLAPFLAVTILGAVGFMGYTALHFRAVTHDLEDAKATFDGVHVLWKTRAAGYQVHQSATMISLDPAHSSQYAGDIRTQAAKVIRIPDSASLQQVGQQIKGGNVSDELGGFLVTEFRSTTSGGELDSALSAMYSFNQYATDAASSGAGASTSQFKTFIKDIDNTTQIKQGSFDTLIASASGATDGIGLANTILALSIVILFWLAIRPRSAEFPKGF